MPNGDEELKKNADVSKCGIVMPIAAMGEYSEGHWAEVLEILKDAVHQAGLDANLVSYTEESALIHTTIVQNLFDNPIVICDVSGKNPNVMFELGMRLAFDKPTIIIKDDITSYSFDTSPVEHIAYPHDLRFAKIIAFKAKLAEKITATVAKSKADPKYSTFLKHFQRVTIAKLENQEVTGQEFVVKQLEALRLEISGLSRKVAPTGASRVRYLPERKGTFRIPQRSQTDITHVQNELSASPYIAGWGMKFDDGIPSFEVEFSKVATDRDIESVFRLFDGTISELPK